MAVLFSLGNNNNNNNNYLLSAISSELFVALYNIVKPALSVIIDIQVNYYF